MAEPFRKQETPLTLLRGKLRRKINGKMQRRFKWMPGCCVRSFYPTSHLNGGSPKKHTYLADVRSVCTRNKRREADSDSPIRRHELANGRLNTNLKGPLHRLQRRNHMGQCLSAARERAAIHPCHVFVLRECLGHQRRDFAPFPERELFACHGDGSVPRARSS